MAETDIERLTRQLGDQAVLVERLERRLTEVATEMRRQQGVQGSLAQAQLDMTARMSAMRSPTEPDAPNPSANVEWMTVDDADLAIVALLDLRRWVDGVWVHYDPISECWPWHPPVVAELLACRRMWLGATAKNAPSMAAATWHVQHRPAAGRTIKNRLKDCSAGHRIDKTEYDIELTQLGELAAWWAGTHGAGDVQVPPGLTLQNP